MFNVAKITSVKASNFVSLCCHLSNWSLLLLLSDDVILWCDVKMSGRCISHSLIDHLFACINKLHFVSSILVGFEYFCYEHDYVIIICVSFPSVKKLLVTIHHRDVETISTRVSTIQHIVRFPDLCAVSVLGKKLHTTWEIVFGNRVWGWSCDFFGEVNTNLTTPTVWIGLSRLAVLVTPVSRVCQPCLYHPVHVSCRCVCVLHRVKEDLPKM